MKYAYVVAEGQTEEVFVRDVLGPSLNRVGIHPIAVVLTTKRLASGPNHRGGVRSWDQVEREVRRLLGDSSAVAVTTMIDLYALPATWPGHPSSAAPRARVQGIEAAMAEAVGDARFHPHLSLHEFEAMLFADVTACAQLAGDPAVGRLLQAAVAECGEPELVDDGPDTAPSKRVRAAWPRFSKVTDGTAAIDRIGLAQIRAACPHLDAWVSRLEALA